MRDVRRSISLVILVVLSLVACSSAPNTTPTSMASGVVTAATTPSSPTSTTSSGAEDTVTPNAAEHSITTPTLIASLPTPPPSPTPSTRPDAENTITLPAVADATVDQSAPDANYGASPSLSAFGSLNKATAAYLRFSVFTGLNESVRIQKAVLRLYCIDNGTARAPAAYRTSDAWSEDSISWETAPGPASGTLDPGGEPIEQNTWAEWDVTSTVTGLGTYNFLVWTTNPDGAIFSSRSGTNPPQLVITLAPKP